MKSKKRYGRIHYQVSRDSHILFIGTNPSPGSYQNGIPFSSNKSFWYLLNDAGLLSENQADLQNITILKKIFREQFTKQYHLGLMNLVHRPTPKVVNIKPDEAIPGSLKVVHAIHKYCPRVVVFVGKGTYQLFSNTSQCNYGWQPSIGHSRIFVMHSPLHGLARIRIKELKEIGRTAQLLC